MSKIVLHGPTVRNDGSYADAGLTLTIGTKADQISEDRAKQLVSERRAIKDASEKAPRKASTSKRKPAAVKPVTPKSEGLPSVEQTD